MSRRRAEMVATKLLRTAGEVSPPVDPARFTRGQGISLRRRELPPSQSGFLLRLNGQAVIVVNGTHSAKRQRFTVAHELGHFLLHAVKESYDFHARDENSALGT